VPAPLREDELPVHEKPGLFGGGSLRFGDFAAREVDHGWAHGSSFTLLVWGKDEAHQDFSFRFEEPGQPPRGVACRAAYEGSHIDIGRLHGQEGRQTLECRFGPQGAAAPEGILRLGFETGPDRLELGEVVLHISPSTTFENGGHSGAPLGYLLEQKGEPIAAVDTNKTGTWLRRDAQGPLRTGAALGTAILMIYRPQEPPK
jgi:hypothetical protein